MDLNVQTLANLETKFDIFEEGLEGGLVAHSISLTS